MFKVARRSLFRRYTPRNDVMRVSAKTLKKYIFMNNEDKNTVSAHFTWRNVLIFSTCNFLFFLSLWMQIAFNPVYFKQALSLSDSRIGLLTGIFSFVTIIVVVPFGILTDYFSSKRLIQAGVLLYTVWPIGLLVYDEFALLVIFYIAGGLGGALFLICLNSLYYRHVEARDRGRKIGVFIFSMIAGFAIGPFITGMILDSGYSMKMVYSLCLGINVCLFFFTSLLSELPGIRFKFLEYKEDISNKKIFLLVVLVFIFSSHIGVEQTSYALLMKHIFHFNVSKIGSVYLILGIWVGIMTLILGYFSDKRESALNFAVYGLLISGIFQYLTVYVSGYSQFLLIRMAHTIGDSMVILSQGLLISVIFPKARMGGNIGVFYAVRTGTIFIMASFTGCLNQLYNYKAPFIVSGLFVSIITIFSLFFYKSLKAVIYDDVK